MATLHFTRRGTGKQPPPQRKELHLGAQGSTSKDKTSGLTMQGMSTAERPVLSPPVGWHI